MGERGHRRGQVAFQLYIVFFLETLLSQAPPCVGVNLQSTLATLVLFLKP